jgi:hypothetical protein
MTDRYDDINPLAQIEAEREILRLNRLLSEITEAYAGAARERAQAEIAYETTRAAIWPTIDTHLAGEKLLAAEREAMLLLQVADEYERVELAKAEEKQLSKRSTNILGQLNALQTISANIRHAVAYPSGRGG